MLSRTSVPSAVPTALSAALATRLSGEQVALGRTAMGTSMLVRPTLLPALLGVDSATGRRMSWVTQMLGARELALGLGTTVAVRRGGSGARLWLYAGAVSDGVDALVLGAGVARGRVSRLTGLAAVAIAVAAVAAQLSALREPADR